MISKHPKQAVVLYRVLAAVSVLVFAIAFIGVLLGHLIIPWFIEMAALGVLISSESLASQFLL